MEANNAPLTESIKSVETMTQTPALNGQPVMLVQQAKHAVELVFAQQLALTNVQLWGNGLVFLMDLTKYVKIQTMIVVWNGHQFIIVKTDFIAQKAKKLVCNQPTIQQRLT